MVYSWKFYLLVAHLVDEHGHTACNRQLKQVDEMTLTGMNLEPLKCKTCKKYEQKELAKKQPKEPWINPDTFSRQYEREAEREWK